VARLLAWALRPKLDFKDGSCDSSARWHSAGRRVLYLADSPAGALLEARVHLVAHPLRLPRSYLLHEVLVPATAPRAVLPVDSLPPRWKKRQRWSRAVGDEWQQRGSTAILRVPSAVVEGAWNFVLNLEHTGLARLRVRSCDPHRFDPRLFIALARPGSPRTR